jgi:uncharacterized damage-inducible protein DinB
MALVSDPTCSSERSDLLATLAKHRFLLLNTLRGLRDEQAAARTTVSELCLGGVIKHVTEVERSWSRFIVEGPSAMGGGDHKESLKESVAKHSASFRMEPSDTIAGLLADYAGASQATDELVATLPSLDAAQPLPEAPWFAAGSQWSARRVLLHLIAETAQHAGHADILREAIDGAKSM